MAIEKAGQRTFADRLFDLLGPACEQGRAVLWQLYGLPLSEKSKTVADYDNAELVTNRSSGNRLKVRMMSDIVGLQ
jgi:hypothetical protein